MRPMSKNSRAATRAAWWAALVLLVSPGAAGAYSILIDPFPNAAAVSDTVYVSVYLSVDPGEQGVELFSVSVFADAGVVSYVQPASSNASYLLYSPAAGAQIATYLVPSQTPMQTWPVPPPGVVQVNVNFQETNLGTTMATGQGIWLATLAFHVDAPGLPNLALSFAGGGNIFRANGQDISDQVTLGFTPEPGTALLVGSGVALLAAVRRRRSR